MFFYVTEENVTSVCYNFFEKRFYNIKHLQNPLKVYEWGGGGGGGVILFKKIVRPDLYHG